MKKLILALLLISLSHASLVQAADTLQITPESLRMNLLANNNSLLSRMQQLYQAKNQVNLARAQLFPSLNLGLTLASSGPSFILSSAVSLLPFLLPSNWFRLRASQHLFEAEKIAFHLMQLNEFASAYSLYATLSADQQLRAIALKEYINLTNIKDVLEKQDDLYGNVNFHDVAQARAQAAQALYNVQKLDELLAKEIAAMRLALALPLDTTIEISAVQVPAPELEGGDLVQLVSRAEALAPEKKQLDFLLAAAKDAKWAEIFSFLTGATLSAQSQGAGQPVSFAAISAGGSIGIGLGIFPAVALSNGNISQIELRRQEVHQEMIQVLETTTKSIATASEQMQAAHTAEAGFATVYEYELQQYWQGLTDILHVLNAENAMTNAAISRVSSQLDIDNLRIAFHRAFLSGEFAAIPGCRLATMPKRDNSWFKRRPEKSVEELCSTTP